MKDIKQSDLPYPQSGKEAVRVRSESESEWGVSRGSVTVTTVTEGILSFEY